MNIIFLDIDGVLTSNRLPDRDSWGITFDPDCVQALRDIVESSDLPSGIVISSTWRHSGVDVMTEMWLGRHMPGVVIDVTGPRLNNRGKEIKAWLKEREQQAIIRIDNYLIIDDDCDFTSVQKRRHVHTNPLTGLTKEDVPLASSILKGQLKL